MIVAQAMMELPLKFGWKASTKTYKGFKKNQKGKTKHTTKLVLLKPLVRFEAWSMDYLMKQWKTKKERNGAERNGT